MNIRRIDHVQLAMPPGQENKARAFYGAVLGIPEKTKPAHLAKRGGVWFEAQTLKVHLGVEAEFRAAKKAHPAFEVENLAALVAACHSKGNRSPSGVLPLTCHIRTMPLVQCHRAGGFNGAIEAGQEPSGDSGRLASTGWAVSGEWVERRGVLPGRVDQ